MRVIEELIRHFAGRGSLSSAEISHLVKHGFVRPEMLPGYQAPESESASPPPDDWSHLEEEARAKDAEAIERKLGGRRGGKKGGGKAAKPKLKPKPTGHDLGPLSELLRDRYFPLRAVYPALVRWGKKLGSCTTWVEAAALIGDADADELETALVKLLNSRPQSFAELWYWFDVSSLAAWAEDESGGGPVAEGLAKMLVASTLHQVGRAAQLMKSGEIRDLTMLLAARRRFIEMLRRIYDNHFDKLGKWLATPKRGQAVGCWPALPWAFVAAYSARRYWQPSSMVPDFEVNGSTLEPTIQMLAITTAFGISPSDMRREYQDKLKLSSLMFSPRMVCPLSWRLPPTG